MRCEVQPADRWESSNGRSAGQALKVQSVPTPCPCFIQSPVAESYNASCLSDVLYVLRSNERCLAKPNAQLLHALSDNNASMPNTGYHSVDGSSWSPTRQTYQYASMAITHLADIRIVIRICLQDALRRNVPSPLQSRIEALDHSVDIEPR